MATAKGLRGLAPLTLVRTTDARLVYVYRGRPSPENITDAERTRLLEGKFLEEYDLPAAVVKARAAAGAAGSSSSGSSGSDDDVPELGGSSVKKIEAYVGDDKALAQAYLDAEQAKPVDGQRSSLIESLEKIVDA